MNEYYVGIDFGTTNLKIAVFSSEGQLADCFRIPTPAAVPAPVGYDPNQVFEMICSLLKLAGNRYRLSGIAITGMAEAGIMLRRDTGRPLTGIIPWSDPCTIPLAQRWSGQEEEGFLITGLRNSYKYGVYKYLWSLDAAGCRPKDTCWLSACDYLAYRLTGRIFTDPTFAARTYVYHLWDGTWDWKRIERFGLDCAWFPDIFPSGVPGGRLLPGILPDCRDIPVAICGHDHLCAAFGLWDMWSSGIVNSMGTAEIFLGLDGMRRFTLQEVTSGLTFGVFVKPEQRYWMANIPAAGRSIDWAIETFLSGAGYEEFEKAITQAGKIEDCPLFYPFLNGSGTPDYDATKKGAFTGLRLGTSVQDFINAVVNGLCCQERYLLELAGAAPELPVLVTGSAAASAPWMQRKADILQRNIICNTQTEGTLFGAVALLCRENNFPFAAARGNTVQYTPETGPLWNGIYIQYQNGLNIKL